MTPNDSNQNEDEEIVSTTPSEEDLSWIKTENDSIIKTGEQLDKIATYFIGLVTTAYAFYTGLLIFLKITIPFEFSFQFLILILPFLFWIFSIAFNLWVFKPNLYTYYEESPDSIKNVYRERNTTKYKYLRKGIILFIIGIICISLVLFSGISKTPETPKNIQFIVNESKISSLTEIPIEIVNNSHKTIEYPLIASNDYSYQIRLRNGSIAEIPRSWIQIVIINR